MRIRMIGLRVADVVAMGAGVAAGIAWVIGVVVDGGSDSFGVDEYPEHIMEVTMVWILLLLGFLLIDILIFDALRL